MNQLSHFDKKLLIDRNNPDISISHQAELLSLSRSSLYYKPQPQVSEYDKMVMDEIDKIYTRFPSYGKRRMSNQLKRNGFDIGVKKARKLMLIMGLEAIYPKPNTSKSHPEHYKFPYLLRNKVITKPNEVWATDITYIRTAYGWLYLVAIIDWYSRYVLAHRTSITLEADFCIEALLEALKCGCPDYFNSDQGVQFTSNDFINILQSNNINISMDGRGRCFDNIFTERLWRSLKYEEVYVKDYQSVLEAKNNINEYFQLYNQERLHQSLNYHTPAEIYFSKKQILNCPLVIS